MIDPTLASSAAAPNTVIAEILLNEGLLSREQLEYARRVHAKLATPQPILKILLELGFITDEQIRRTLHSARFDIRLGTLLLELGYIKAADLDKATERIKEDPSKKLGEILIANNWVDEDTVFETLSFQLGFPFVELDPAQIDRDLYGKAPAKVYRLNELVPVRREGEEILVVFANPLDQQHRETAQRLFGHRVQVGIAGPRAIAETIAYLENGARTTSGPEESQVVQAVNDILRQAIEQKASDIHIEPLKNKLRVRFRSDGVLLPQAEYPREMIAGITSRLKVMAGSDLTEKRRHQDGRILYGHDEHQIDIRVSFFATIYGEKIVLRILNKQDQLLDLERIGLTPRMLQRLQEEALDPPSGVILVTGPTGSGKTTTLYSAIKKLNTPQVSIVTAEEPVEYVIEGIAQCSINPRINLSFEESLRHMVRQDPDILVIGEIRDRLSADTAIHAALTGHKVLTTFHTEDSIGGLLRLLNMNIEAFLISSTVVSVIAQRLVRRLCPHCSESHTLSPYEIRRLGYRLEAITGVHFKRSKGCRHCRFLGYKGRVGVFELLILNEEVREAIIARKTAAEIRKISIETTGLTTLLEDGILKAYNGLTSYEELMRHLPRLAPPRPISELRRLGGVL